MDDQNDTTESGLRHEDEDEHGLAPHAVLDLKQFGRRLRAARILAGYDRASDFVAVLRSQYGLDISDRTLYAIERGEQMPGLDFGMSVFALLQAELGFFKPAIRDDVYQSFIRRPPQ